MAENRLKKTKDVKKKTMILHNNFLSIESFISGTFLSLVFSHFLQGKRLKHLQMMKEI